jgi:hypothetical protein
MVEQQQRQQASRAPALDLDVRDLIEHLLENIDRVRERQASLARRLNETLQSGSHVERWGLEPVNVVALRRAWHEFISTGGVTADDWRAFCLGEKISTQLIKAPIKTKRHLRLISQRVAQPRIRVHSRKPDPPEAA